MTTAATLTVRRLCDSVVRLEHDSATDGQLLRRFLDLRDEAAFAVLLRRHAAMVLGVCRRVLRDPHDADDAFQVAFFVLVRKANALTHRRTVGDWLYGVAYHTALKTRAASVKRREKERHSRPPAAADAEPDSDLLPLLDRELQRLPEKYRTPIILCELEGKSRRDAARLLGVPEGTLSSRLATAKKRLGRRLTQLGLPGVGGTLSAVLADGVSAASPTLLESTAEAAAHLAAAGGFGLIPSNLVLLTEGVMKSMLLAKLKVAAGAALIAGTIALSVVGFATRTVQADVPVAVAQKRDEPNSPTEAPKPTPVAPKIPTNPLKAGSRMPQADVRGTVKAVQGTTAGITLGKDHGVSAGDVLEVFRLDPKPTYLGTLRISVSRPDESVGTFSPANKTSSIQKGDQVATRLEPDSTPPIIPASVRSGATQKAIDAAVALPANDQQTTVKRKSRLLDFIARAQAKDGDRDGAAKTSQLAIDAAKSVNDESEQWWLLMQISSAQAEADLLPAALKTVDLIKSAEPKANVHVLRQKDAMRYFIVQSLAKAGKIAEAKELLESIKIRTDDTSAHNQALLAVLDGQIAKKDFAAAAELVASFPSWGFRRQGYGTLVTALARDGQRDEARKIIRILRKEMDGFRDDEPTLWAWVNEVAHAQGMIGDVKEAQEWIDKLKSPELRAEAQFALLNGISFAPKPPRK